MDPYLPFLEAIKHQISIKCSTIFTSLKTAIIKWVKQDCTSFETAINQWVKQDFSTVE